MIANLFRGFCMALADSVPGVSGGSIAFILGFYDKFINSLNDLMGRDNKKRMTAIKFLLKLGIGWVIGMVLAVSVLASVFETGIYKVSSLFLGFIILSIPIMIAEEKESIKGNIFNVLWIFAGIALVVGITMIKPGTIDVSDLGITEVAYIFIAGMIAISAMVLPGISGSTVLLTFGLYVPVISAVKELIHFNFSNLTLVIILGLGVIAGVFVSLRFIKKALEKFRCQTIYCVVGMMIGSLYAIVQGPTTLKEPKAAMSFDTFSILFFIIGVAIVFALQISKSFFANKNNSDI